MATSKAWTNKEITFLKVWYKKLTAKELAETLKRTEGSVRWKIADLGIKNDGSERWVASHPAPKSPFEAPAPVVKEKSIWEKIKEFFS